MFGYSDSIMETMVKDKRFKGSRLRDECTLGILQNRLVLALVALMLHFMIYRSETRKIWLFWRKTRKFIYQEVCTHSVHIYLYNMNARKYVRTAINVFICLKNMWSEPLYILNGLYKNLHYGSLASKLFVRPNRFVLMWMNMKISVDR